MAVVACTTSTESSIFANLCGLLGDEGGERFIEPEGAMREGGLG